jgi:hypothetical protein
MSRLTTWLGIALLGSIFAIGIVACDEEPGSGSGFFDTPFECGEGTCESGTEYCEERIAGTTTYTCKDIPDECPDLDPNQCEGDEAVLDCIENDLCDGGVGCLDGDSYSCDLLGGTRAFHVTIDERT